MISSIVFAPSFSGIVRIILPGGFDRCGQNRRTFLSALLAISQISSTIIESFSHNLRFVFTVVTLQPLRGIPGGAYIVEPSTSDWSMYTRYGNAAGRLTPEMERADILQPFSDIGGDDEKLVEDPALRATRDLPALHAGRSNQVFDEGCSLLALDLCLSPYRCRPAHVLFGVNKIPGSLRFRVNRTTLVVASQSLTQISARANVVAIVNLGLEDVDKIGQLCRPLHAGNGKGRRFSSPLILWRGRREARRRSRFAGNSRPSRIYMRDF